jgi:hypothetical protein
MRDAAGGKTTSVDQGRSLESEIFMRLGWQDHVEICMKRGRSAKHAVRVETFKTAYEGMKRMITVATVVMVTYYRRHRLGAAVGSSKI